MHPESTIITCSITYMQGICKLYVNVLIKPTPYVYSNNLWQYLNMPLRNIGLGISTINIIIRVPNYRDNDGQNLQS